MAAKIIALTLMALVASVISDQSYQPSYKQPGMPYKFQYAVEDGYNGVNFGQNEESNGNEVAGKYEVVLPDGRIQKVQYVADHKQGFQAKVSYEGEAQFPKEFDPPFVVPVHKAPSYH